MFYVLRSGALQHILDREHELGRQLCATMSPSSRYGLNLRTSSTNVVVPDRRERVVCWSPIFSPHPQELVEDCQKRKKKELVKSHCTVHLRAQGLGHADTGTPRVVLCALILGRPQQLMCTLEKIEK